MVPLFAHRVHENLSPVIKIRSSKAASKARYYSRYGSDAKKIATDAGVPRLTDEFVTRCGNSEQKEAGRKKYSDTGNRTPSCRDKSLR